MGTKAEYKFINNNDGQTLSLSGPIDETTGPDLLALIPKIKAKCTINLQNVSNINSVGAMAWFRFINILGNAHTITLEACSLDFVRQLNMVKSFKGKATIKSICAQYFCDFCGIDEIATIECIELVDIANFNDKVSTCAKCGQKMDLSEDLNLFAKSISRESAA